MADEVVRDIPEEMVDKAAQAIHDVSCDCGGSAADSDVSVEQARAALSAALAGRTVVELPEPEKRGGTLWFGPFGAGLIGGEPAVLSADVDRHAAVAEVEAAQMLAAAREARSLASGSGVGDQP